MYALRGISPLTSADFFCGFIAYSIQMYNYSLVQK